MLKVFMKKAFFDTWDNILALILLNAINLIPLGLIVFAFITFTNLGDATLILLFALVIKAILDCFIAVYVSPFVKSEKANITKSFKALKGHYLHIIYYFVFEVLILVILIYVIPFYLSFNTIFTISIALLLGWAVLFLLFGLSYYFALAIAFEADKPFKTFKKSFIFVFDNFSFTFFFFFYQLFNVVLSIFFATLIPGFAANALSQNVAVSLFIKKYIYFDENHVTDRKNIDWAEVLKEEFELLNSKTLKGTLFPWKE